MKHLKRNFISHKPAPILWKHFVYNEYNISKNPQDRESTAATLDLASSPQVVYQARLTVLYLKERNIR